MSVLVVKPDRVRKMRNQYPWLFADEVQELRGEPQAGELVELQDGRGDFIARAFYSPTSHVAARVLTLDPTERITRQFFEERFRRAAARRAETVKNTNAMRLVHAEADGLSGLIVDRFAETLIVQFRNAGVERLRREITQALKKAIPVTGAFEKSETQARTEEGLEMQSGVLFGEVPDALYVREDDVEFLVTPRNSQKTGLYLDQRDNHRLLREMVSAGNRVLDVYSYTGGFSMYAARAGAQVLAVDKDREALAQLEANALRNGVAERVGVRWGDAEQVLGELVKERRSFSHIVLDPPTLAKHKSDLHPARQIFTSLATSAFKLLEPNGVVFLSTCAYNFTVNDLVETARIGAGESGRRVEVITVTYQPPDHPWVLQIPETLYLKTLVMRAD